LAALSAIVRSCEIHTIKKWLGEYDHEDIDISEIMPGDFVRITSANSLAKRPFYWIAAPTRP
jgi:hypothetical protein